MTSRRKRRKISGESDDGKSFREELVKMFTGSMWKLSWKNYLRVVRPESRKKHSVNEIKTLSRGMRGKRFEFGEGIDTEKYQEKFEKMTSEERIKEINSFGTEHSKLILENMLKRWKLTQLRNFLKNHKPDEKNVSKVHTIEEITNKYFGISTDLEKRKLEKDNISILESSNEEYRFVKICNTQIPVEIVIIILGFMKYDSDMLFSVGVTCKMFYVTILKSWDNVKISKDNVYKISILVLNNVKSVTFAIEEKKKTFRTEEFEHVLKHTNPLRLSNVTLIMPIDSYVKTLRFLCRKKNSSYFQNLKSIKYKLTEMLGRIYGYSPIRKVDYNAYRKPWKGISIRNISSKLQVFHNPVNFQILDSLPQLTALSIDLTIPELIEKSEAYRNSRMNDPNFTSLPRLCSKERESGLNKSQIQKLYRLQ